MNKTEKVLDATTREETIIQTGFSLLGSLREANSPQGKDEEFVLYLASLIGQELELSPSMMATLKYGPLLGTSAKIELEQSDDLVFSDPAQKIPHYLDSANSIFAPRAEDWMGECSPSLFSPEDTWPDHLEQLEEEIDMALDVLMVADIFNRLVNAQVSQDNHSILQAMASLSESPPANLNPKVISALKGAVEKRLCIH